MCIENVLQLISIGISLIILLFAILIPRRISKNQLFSELVSEYRSDRMGQAIKAVWDFYRKVTGCESRDVTDIFRNRTKLLKEYAKEYKDIYNKEKPFEELRNHIHFHRRVIIDFYKSIALLRYGSGAKLSRKKIKEFFSLGGFDIIAIVWLIQLETENIINKEQKVIKNIDSSNVLLFRLFEDVKRREESRRWKRKGEMELKNFKKKYHCELECKYKLFLEDEIEPRAYYEK